MINNPIPHENLEMRAAELYRSMGHRIQRVVSRQFYTSDLVIRSEHGEKWLVRCERQDTVDEAAVRKLYSAMEVEGATQGIMIATGVITGDAQHFAEAFPIHLMDLHQFQECIRQASAFAEGKTKAI